MPKMEIPAAFRELAERASRRRRTYEKMKSAAEEATTLEDTYATRARARPTTASR
jgi:hypothetical protein